MFRLKSESFSVLNHCNTSRVKDFVNWHSEKVWSIESRSPQIYTITIWFDIKPKEFLFGHHNSMNEFEMKFPNFIFSTDLLICTDLNIFFQLVLSMGTV